MNYSTKLFQKPILVKRRKWHITPGGLHCSNRIIYSKVDYMSKVEEFLKSKKLMGVDAHVYTDRDSSEVWTLPQLLEDFQRLLLQADVSSSKKYTAAWWDPDAEALEEVLSNYPGWEIVQMFLVYTAENESYRILLSQR
jgi:hypothetical protein